MRLGVWCPLPHTIRPEPRLDDAIADLTQAGAGAGSDKMLSFSIETLQKAEQLGFETSLIAERWLGPDPSAWMMGAALAMATQRMEIMIAVHPGIMQPQQVAKLGATLDRISAGRAAVNIVNGWWEEEFALFSNGATQADASMRYRRMDEYIQVLRGLWQNESFDFRGEFYTVKNAGLPLKCVQQPSPPLYAGTRAAEGQETIARYGDVWFVSYDSDFRLYENNLEKVCGEIAMMREKAARHGRSLQFGMSCHVVCAPADQQAIAAAEDFEGQASLSRMAFVAARALGAGLVGSPQTVAQRIRAYENAGVSTFMLHFHPMIEGMEYFACEVVPLTQSAPLQFGAMS